ncbi:hypothetical protein C8Q78DRAFT_989985 [Trametes maxima]|nr:hypothetical protein C8Q78DRAFT_989985 [Trametes maxima]
MAAPQTILTSVSSRIVRPVAAANALRRADDPARTNASLRSYWPYGCLQATVRPLLRGAQHPPAPAGAQEGEPDAEMPLPDAPGPPVVDVLHSIDNHWARSTQLSSAQFARPTPLVLHTETGTEPHQHRAPSECSMDAADIQAQSFEPVETGSRDPSVGVGVRLGVAPPLRCFAGFGTRGASRTGTNATLSGYYSSASTHTRGRPDW